MPRAFLSPSEGAARGPAALGQLHGHALGRFATQARRDALAAAPWAGRQLRELVAAAAGADALRARADALVRTVEASERRAGAVLASVRRLPTWTRERQG